MHTLILAASAKSQDNVESCIVHNVVVCQSAFIFEIFSSVDQALLIWWHSILVLLLQLLLNTQNCVVLVANDRVHGSCKRFHKDLHFPFFLLPCFCFSYQEMFELLKSYLESLYTSFFYDEMTRCL